ncbi:MAG TPA: hypothetical protein VLV54_02510, partial [Thermoanaerobaculia bacterium]|nr:hypothetical protein [Thermoanaerobaculia bacterium]
AALLSGRPEVRSLSLFSETSAIWRRLEARREAHKERFQERVHRFLDKYHVEMRLEVTRLATVLRRDEHLGAHLVPIADALDDYVYWMRWSGWLAAQLAPPLELEEEEDARRFAVAVTTYLGARLVDDGFDDHPHFKGKHPTVLGVLVQSYPDLPRSVLQCSSALLGFWVLHQGLQRMRQLGCESCADNTAQLFSRIPPGALAEVLCRQEVTRAEYKRIVQRKAVAYDMILYQNLLAPVESGTRRRLLTALAGASEIAQYLNDFMDLKDDGQRHQPNLLRCGFETSESVWGACLDQAEKELEAVALLPEPLQDAIATVFAEVFEASLTLWDSEYSRDRE